MTKTYGYPEARQTLQWLISARVMWRQAESEQAQPNPARLKEFDEEIERLQREWAGLERNDANTIARIERVYEPEVQHIFALLGERPTPRLRPQRDEFVEWKLDLHRRNQSSRSADSGIVDHL